MAGNTSILPITLRVFKGTELVESREYREGGIKIGRGDLADVRLDDSAVEDLHAVINVSGETVQLVHLGGDETRTELKGEAVNNTELATGDMIAIGPFRIEATFGDEDYEEEDVVTTIGEVPQVAAPEEESEPVETVEDPLEFALRAGKGTSNFGIDAKGPKVLEISQIWENALVDSRHFIKGGRPVTIGSSVGNRWYLLGTRFGWVPDGAAKFLPWVPPIWSDVQTEWKNDFYTPDTSLPAGQDHQIATWDGTQYVVRIDSHWSAFADVDGKRVELDQLIASGKARRVGQLIEVPIADDTRIVVDVDGILFFAHMVRPGKKAVVKLADTLDYPLLSILSVMLGIGLAAGLFMANSDYDMSVAANEDLDRFVDLVLDKPEPEKKDKPDANPDAGEGAKAKKEEGKVGKKDAKKKKVKGNKRSVDKAKRDREVAETAGLLGSMDDMGGDAGFGTAGLDAAAAGGIGGLIGVKGGNQAGSGGLGSRGSGLGGGGSAEGLGGLGTKGSGSGRSGFGKGGGDFGAKGEGGLSARRGNPIIMGALDRSLIDEVIKRKMRQIRYCYQRELAKDPSMAGKVVIGFTIAGNGSVSKANVKSSTLGASTVEKCVVDRFYQMQFPEPKGGGIVLVSYPFIFSPGS